MRAFFLAWATIVTVVAVTGLEGGERTAVLWCVAVPLMLLSLFRD